MKVEQEMLSGKTPNSVYLGIKTALVGIKRWDWRAIVLSYLTACTFWIFQSLNAEHSALIDLPITLSYDPTRFVLMTDPPKNLQVHVTGYGWNLVRSSLGIGLEPIQINAPRRMFGRVGMTALMPAVNEQLSELKVNKLVTDSLDFQLDTLVMKYLPLQIPEKDVPLGAYVRLASNIIVAPSQIALKGPASILVQPIYQQSVSVKFPEGTQINEDYEGWLEIDLRQNPYIAVEERVKVRFKVARFSLQTVRAKLVLENFPQKHNFVIEPDTASIQYWLMEGHEPTVSEATVIIDYKNIHWEDSSLAPQIKLSSKFVEPSVLPSTFRVRKQGGGK